MDQLPELSLSHFELNVDDAENMADFYTRVMGFIVTDRGAGSGGMIFLSRNAQEHHQIVLNPDAEKSASGHRLDHLSFRVGTIEGLRAFHARLFAAAVELDTVSHGTTWSIYFRDPEENRLEVFTETPWHVNQPCRFAVDLTLDDHALTAYTRIKIEGLPGFRPVAEWRTSHAPLITGKD